MSRCFPYPPPGYSLASRGDGKGHLIESIKLQKDKEKAKEERRKERKREKKDKKRKREVQLNETVDGFGQGELNKEKSRKLEKQTSSLKGKYAQSHGDDESSDVTEEHKQPVCVVKPSYSSENSQNSNKRRHESAANSIKADGSVLKIRLSSFKKKEPNVINRDDVGPSTSGRTDPIGQKDSGFGPRLVKGQPFSSSVSAGICALGLIPTEKQPSLRFVDARTSSQDVAVSKSSTSKASKTELLYKSLLETWAPPAQGTEWYDDDEQDWLFKKKSQNTERSETNSNAPCSLDSNLWPHTQFLPSVNVYALPYTVPF